ncbi:hypothetical protein KRR26_24390 [Corallococcus sp. M34]|uniref:hypothetical protein n=1 Tax=Citreicoccus inhibens TaxID=2849499 RepID=UPI0011C49308|nr:hypothetical protein [Citreicoccus inhibens]MBU8898753.1 hypothetical protein [Citreicoccus inhibens]
MNVLVVVVVLGLVFLGLNQSKGQRLVPIALGVLTGVVQACAGVAGLLFFLAGSIRALLHSGSTSVDGAVTFVLCTSGLLALGLYEVRVAWRARAPAAAPPSSPPGPVS